MVGLETFPAMLDSQRSFGHGTEGPLAHFRTGCSRERAVRPSSYTLNRFQKIDRLSESSAVDIEAVVSLFSEDSTSSHLQHFFVVCRSAIQSGRSRKIGRRPDIGTFLGAARFGSPVGSKRVHLNVGPSVSALCRRVPGNVVGRSRSGSACASQTDGDCLDVLGRASRELPSNAKIQRGSRPAMGLDFDKLTPDEQRRVLDGLDLNG